MHIGAIPYNYCFFQIDRRPIGRWSEIRASVFALKLLPDNGVKRPTLVFAPTRQNVSSVTIEPSDHCVLPRWDAMPGI